MKLTDVFPQIKTDKVQSKKNREVGTSQSVSSASSVKGDRVEISSGTKDVQRMQQILQDTPDVRMEKIEALKKEIAQGKYLVDSLAVADKMLTSLITENPLKQ